jgi:hypothetical protein
MSLDALGLGDAENCTRKGGNGKDNLKIKRVKWRSMKWRQSHTDATNNTLAMTASVTPCEASHASRSGEKTATFWGKL